MTRKEEISKAAEKELKDCPYINTSLIGFDFFIKGAEWADSHPHWISVEDELPMEYEPVLAAFGNHYARVCFCSGGKWYIDAGVISDEVFGVSHWMHLSPPPIITSSKKGGEK